MLNLKPCTYSECYGDTIQKSLPQKPTQVNHRVMMVTMVTAEIAAITAPTATAVSRGC